MLSTSNPMIKTYRSIPWLVAFGALLSAVASMTTGIIIIATWKVHGDIALGVLTLFFAVWGMAGSIVALVLLVKQNKLLRAQASYLTEASHDLRIPLNQLKILTESLSNEYNINNTQNTSHIDAIFSEIQHIEEISEDIFDYRLKSLMKPKKNLSVSNAMNEILKPFQLDENSRNRLHYELIDPLPPISVLFEDLNRAISDILKVSFEQNPAGHIYVRVFQANKGVTIEIRDEAPASEDKRKEVILEPIANENLKKQTFPELGLTWVKKFTKTYKSKLSTTNHPEGGTIFTLWVKQS